MSKRIAIIQGHPDPKGGHLGHALAEAYAAGATQAGHEVSTIAVAALDFPLLRSQQEFETGAPAESIREAQETIRQADHLVILYPLWLGDVPAVLKAFLEQVFRPAFVTGKKSITAPGAKVLAGKSSRIVVTMGMPAFIYRWLFGAHSLKSLMKNILRFCGMGRIDVSLIGGAGGLSRESGTRWTDRMRQLGAAAR
jgi:putative NADPH-quinone reductase